MYSKAERRRRRRWRTIGISSERQPRAERRITRKEDEQFEGGIVKAEIESDTERKRKRERVQEAKAFLFFIKLTKNNVKRKLRRKTTQNTKKRV